MKMLIIIVLMLSFTSVYAQYAVYASNNSNSLYQDKIAAKKPAPPGLGMKRIGIAMTIAGGVCIVTGVVMMATADEIRFSTYQIDDDGNVEETTDNQGYYGVLLAANGLGLTGGGIVLWSIGAKKYRSYRPQSSVSVGPTHNGMGVRLRF